MTTSSLDPSPFGINCHVASDAMLDGLAAAGIRWFRFDIDWCEIEPREGELSWDAPDRICRWAAQHDVSLLASIAYVPKWAWVDAEQRSDPDDRGQIPRDADVWTRFVELVVKRYTGQDPTFPEGRVQAFSIWNEPNVHRFWHGSPQTYIERILLPGLAALRRASKEAVAVGPDLASTNKKGHPLKKWLRPTLDAQPNFDVLSHHQYDGGNTVPGRVSLIEEFHAFRSKGAYADKPLWITEIGFRVPTETSNVDTQADTLRQAVQAMIARPWWAKTFWFDSHGPGWGVFDGEETRALPAYKAYREVTERVRFATRQVAHLARAMFGRDPSVTDERDWLQHVLGLAGSLQKLASIFEASAEFQKHRAELGDDEAFTRDVYRAIVNREPDVDGLQATVASLHNGRTAERLADMLESDEFKARVKG